MDPDFPAAILEIPVKDMDKDCSVSGVEPRLPRHRIRIKAEQRDALRQAFAYAAGRQPLGEPLEWPERWLLGGKMSQFD